MEADLTARFGLLRWITGYIQRELELPWASKADQLTPEDDGACVHVNLLHELYSQIFRRVTALPFNRIEKDQFTNVGQGCLFLGLDRQVLLGGSAAQEQRAINLLLEEQEGLVNRPEAKLVGKSYLEAGRKIEELKVAIGLIRKLRPGNSCDRCSRG